MRFVARSIGFHMCYSIFIHVIRTKKLDKELCRFVAYRWGGGAEIPPTDFSWLRPYKQARPILPYLIYELNIRVLL